MYDNNTVPFVYSKNGLFSVLNLNCVLLPIYLNENFYVSSINSLLDFVDLIERYTFETNYSLTMQSAFDLFVISKISCDNCIYELLNENKKNQIYAYDKEKLDNLIQFLKSKMTIDNFNGFIDFCYFKNVHIKYNNSF